MFSFGGYIILLLHRVKKQMTTKSILIVEDEKAIAKALELKLSRTGFDVKVAHDGLQAVARYKEGPLDLILLDLIIPELDGFGVLEELQKLNNKTPIIVLSNLSQGEDKERTTKLGAQGYYVKADTPLVDLIAYINEFLNQHATK